MHIIIIGAGPAGLSTALALLALPSPPTLTILELRPSPQPLGGAIHLTPLALRYLDSLGAGPSIRARAASVRGIDVVALRTGGLLGTMWAGGDAVRVERRVLVEALLERVRVSEGVEVLFGVKVGRVEEVGEPGGEGCVRVEYMKDDRKETLEADVLLGCDGIHSLVRRTLIDPSRPKSFSHRCTAYAYLPLDPTSPPLPSSLLRDTTFLSRGPSADGLLLSHCTPDRTRLYLAAVLPCESEREDPWMVADAAELKAGIEERFCGTIEALRDVVRKAGEWCLFPVYVLPPGGVWSRGRSLLLGDAAHAMPPQGESTGVAIEDGVLLAHVFSRHTSRSIPAMFADYEALRRKDINALYAETVQRWEGAGVPGGGGGGIGDVVVEWFTWLWLKMKAWRGDGFGRDVREMVLPE